MSLFDNVDRVPAVIQVRRGKDAERQIKRYDHGELIYTTDTKRLYTGDGTLSGSYGGVLASSKTWIGPSFANFATQIGDLVYRSDAAPVGTGFYLLTGTQFAKNDIRNYVLVGGEALLSKAIPYSLPKASELTLGGVKINQSPISIDENGFLTLRIDETLAIDNGVLTVIGGGTNTSNNNNNNNNNTNPNVICQPTTTTATVPDNVAVGSVMWFSISTVPDSSYQECDGRSLSKSLYPELFSVIGTTFGGSLTNFNLPDLRSKFIRGWGHGSGTDSARKFGTSQDDSFESHSHTVSDSGHSHSFTVLAQGNHQDGSGSITGGAYSRDEDGRYSGTTSSSNAGVSIASAGGTETRPDNVALLPMMKVKRKDTVLTINTGCVATGTALSMTDGVVNVNVKTNNSLKVDSDNNLYLDTVGLFNNITFDKASTANYGVVKIKDTNSGLDVSNGIISTKIATGSNLGAVAIGDTLDIDSETGVLNVKGGTPIGQIAWFPMSAVPAGWLECDGSSLSGSVYPDLSGAIGTTYGVGDNAPYTFNLPDLRGEFVRGWDHGRNADTGRILGSWQKGTIFGHDNTPSTYGVVGVVYTGGDVSQNITLTAVGLDSYNVIDYPNIQLGSVNATFGTSTLPQFNSDVGSSGTTRPRNVALMPCIYAFNANLTQTAIDVGALAATKADKTSFDALLSSCGYQKMPSGMIMQWGYVFVYSLLEQSISIQYPIPFTNSIVSLTPTLSTNSSLTINNGGNMSLYVQNMNLSSANIWGDSSGPTFTNSYILWQAIGY